MQQAIQHGGDTGSAGEDLVPLLERLVGGQDKRLLLIATIDHLIEQIGRLIIEAEISNFVDAE